VDPVGRPAHYRCNDQFEWWLVGSGLLGMAWAIGSIATLMFVSGAVVALVMREKTRGGPDVARSIEPNVGVQTGLHDNRIS